MRRQCFALAFVATLLLAFALLTLNAPGDTTVIGDDQAVNLFNMTKWCCQRQSSQRLPVRFLLVGDSQTRYLFHQFANALFETPPECWWSALVPSLPRPPSPKTRFAFSWMTQQWPPPFFIRQTLLNNVTLQPPSIVIGFICTEYASNETWVVDGIALFNPTHILIGRGCWDMIRRFPSNQKGRRLRVMCHELSSLISHLVSPRAKESLTMLQGIVLFPALAITYSNAYGEQPVHVQQRKSPWTSCIVSRYQQYYHAGWDACFTTMKQLERSGVSISIMKADDEVRHRNAHPGDGIHYSAPVVVQKLLSSIAFVIDNTTTARHREPQGDISAGIIDLAVTIRRLDSLFEQDLKRNIGCSRAEALYEHSVSSIIGRAFDDVLKQFTPTNRRLIPGNCTVAQFVGCAELRYGLWRYLGPWP
ncbi:membrane-associated protein, putative [Bodo saltans]|uniref:Membrane-associated protein, putative n=1 Tax=Bodo saltans TaxID=75058 RepID=A0A0S4J2Z9_BODSA|nr:membrane-associated protein, putative [Bodo saltans]|eukprot:CUG30704.1 membrane-associated protein, putative [Bodo saltans]